ncbi:Flp pilus assembly protein CpaB [Salibacterium halotolerans]|uniref:Flp pilus assembly protein CpaB n=1 Tax=Salibacterium halotolerans TaxID=1884432 RepID=A0A1I5TS11_9BACI|nr:Flp pilus assembly protein CpaB [Salibacterium halotolerans]SFP85397.1 Flp pilus assembly protein CpaB [Salibacterium halotolerans]
MAAKISLRFIIIIVGALTIAFLVYQYLQSLEEKSTVFVASSTIEANTEISGEDVESVEVDAQSAETLAADSIQSSEEIIGGFALKDIESGDVLTLDEDTIVFPEDRQLYLTAAGEIDVSAFIPKNKRLVTVGLEPDAAVNNVLEKGDWVDVIFTREENDNTYSEMILQQVDVFQVEEVEAGASGGGKAGMVQHVSLLLSPQDAVTLTNAKQQGQIDLVMNPWNGEQAEISPVSLSPQEGSE